MDQTVIIIGASGHARVISDIFEKEGKYRILGFIDEKVGTGESFFGYPVLGKDKDIPTLLNNHPGCQLFIAIGDNWRRYEVCKKISTMKSDIEYASAIHPSAQIGSHVMIGQGVCIMAGSVINSGTIVNDFAIINSSASVDHDNEIGCYASIAPGAVTGGNVKIGEFSAVAIGATILHGMYIGPHAVIGAGALVVHDIAEKVVAYGIPAREIRKRNIGEKYL